MKIYLEDDLLTEEGRLSLIEYWTEYRKNLLSEWVDLENIDSQSYPLKKIVETASLHFDLSSAVGVECWAYFNKQIGLHIDMDECLLKKTGEVSTPLCSTVYYADIQNLSGGLLNIDNNTIEPKTNRLVMFSSGAPHSVEPFTGTRTMLAVNFWHYKIEDSNNLRPRFRK